jgi:hypothetical protein
MPLFQLPDTDQVASPATNVDSAAKACVAAQATAIANARTASVGARDVDEFMSDPPP